LIDKGIWGKLWAYKKKATGIYYLRVAIDFMEYNKWLVTCRWSLVDWWIKNEGY
jgi:hypothetical protein